MLGSEIEQSGAHRVFADIASVAQGRAGDAVANLRPALTEVFRLVDERLEVSDLVEIDGDVGLAGVPLGSVDIPDGAERRKPGF